MPASAVLRAVECAPRWLAATSADPPSLGRLWPLPLSVTQTAGGPTTLELAAAFTFRLLNGSDAEVAAAFNVSGGGGGGPSEANVGLLARAFERVCAVRCLCNSLLHVGTDHIAACWHRSQVQFFHLYLVFGICLVCFKTTYVFKYISFYLERRSAVIACPCARASPSQALAVVFAYPNARDIHSRMRAFAHPNAPRRSSPRRPRPRTGGGARGARAPEGPLAPRHCSRAPWTWLWKRPCPPARPGSRWTRSTLRDTHIHFPYERPPDICKSVCVAQPMPYTYGSPVWALVWRTRTRVRDRGAGTGSHWARRSRRPRRSGAAAATRRVRAAAALSGCGHGASGARCGASRRSRRHAAWRDGSARLEPISFDSDLNLMWLLSRFDSF